MVYTLRKERYAESTRGHREGVALRLSLFSLYEVRIYIALRLPVGCYGILVGNYEY